MDMALHLCMSCDKLYKSVKSKLQEKIQLKILYAVTGNFAARKFAVANSAAENFAAWKFRSGKFRRAEFALRGNFAVPKFRRAYFLPLLLFRTPKFFPLV